MTPSDWVRGTCGSFGWLWLTDFHCGQHGQRWLWPVWQEEFFRDVERVHAQSGPWDVVLFTGDLVFSGQPAEFDALTAMLDRLQNWLAEKQSSVPCFLSVPGNHDLKRPNRDSVPSAALRNYWGDPSIQGAFWGGASNAYRRLVTRAFRSYTDWSERCTFPRPSEYCRGILPGDFSATITQGDAKLGIVGLNTAFLQLEVDPIV